MLCMSAELVWSQATEDDGRKEVDFIYPHVRCWRLTQDYTLADTAVVDTIIAEHQVNSLVWRKTPAAMTLGNLESPSISTYYPVLRRDEGNVFYNALKLTMIEQEDFLWYNTKTPYANLTYQRGIPKRRREEYFMALFTQNVNRRLNLGAKMEMNSPIGRYSHMGNENRRFAIWASYEGERYHFWFQLHYQRFNQEENGGLTNSNFVMYPDSFDYSKTEDMPIRLSDAKNRLATYRYLYAHSLSLGSVTMTEGDSVEWEVPVARLYHKLYIDRSHAEFKVPQLSAVSEEGRVLLPDVYADPERTYDDRKYMVVSNIVQVELNEEFNKLLKFGLRAYIGNDTRWYYNPGESEVFLDEEGMPQLERHRQKAKQSVAYVGAQIGKTSGRRFWWSAGLRFWFAGYNVGDMLANGQLKFSFGRGKWETYFHAEARYALRSPSAWEERYTSNHYKWDKVLDREQSLDISGGFTVPGMNLELSVFSATLHNRVFFDPEGHPTQRSGVCQVLGAYARKHFVCKPGFNSIIKCTVQKTSDNDVVPAPTFALTSTNYWERKFFGVLLTQIGIDIRFNTKYYAPYYLPAIMQFVPQHRMRTGGYGFFDPFINFHLRKLRAYVKYEHLNDLWGRNDYLNAPGYPSNPGTFKFGLSWNFYD